MNGPASHAEWRPRAEAEPDEAPPAKEKGRTASKTRVQLDLSPRAIELLNDLKEKTEASSYAEVFRNALKLYDGIISEVEQGKEFFVKDKDGVIAPIRLFF